MNLRDIEGLIHIPLTPSNRQRLYNRVSKLLANRTDKKPPVFNQNINILEILLERTHIHLYQFKHSPQNQQMQEIGTVVQVLTNLGHTVDNYVKNNLPTAAKAGKFTSKSHLEHFSQIYVSSSRIELDGQHPLTIKSINTKLDVYKENEEVSVTVTPTYYSVLANSNVQSVYQVVGVIESDIFSALAESGVTYLSHLIDYRLYVVGKENGQILEGISFKKNDGISVVYPLKIDSSIDLTKLENFLRCATVNTATLKVSLGKKI